MGSYGNYQSAGIDFGALSAGPQLSKINPAKVGISSGISNALSWGATGASVTGPAAPFAAVGGFLAGIGKGIWDGLKAQKTRNNENIAAVKDFAYQQLNLQEQGAARQRAASATNDPGYYSNAFAKKGGTIPMDIQMFLDEVKVAYKKKYGGPIYSREVAGPGKSRLVNFRAGGSTSVIPKGVYHGRKNELGDKGIPVVVEREGGELEKVAEIEHNELILRKAVTNEVEQRTKIYKNNPDDKNNLYMLGALIFNEVTKNTIDNQGELLKNGKTTTKAKS